MVLAVRNSPSSEGFFIENQDSTVVLVGVKINIFHRISLMTSRFIVAAFALLFLPVPAVGEEHPSLRSECRRLLSSYFNGSFFGRQALLEDIKPLRPYYKEGGTRKRGDYEYTYLPTITVQVTQQQMRDPKAVASLAVLGAWCLVLGAWCLVLGAWCLCCGGEVFCRGSMGSFSGCLFRRVAGRGKVQCFVGLAA